MKKILVIDDSALMRRVMSDIINSTKEYKVTYTAINGIEGLTILEEHSDIVAVFCDVMMPQMNGLELLQVIKRKNINVPFIMFSSSEETSDTLTALELGAIEFIKKPERILGSTNEFFERRVINALNIASDIKDKMDNNYETEEKVVNVSSSRSKKNANSNGNRKLVALVCSTGGPKALQFVIPKLPKNLAAPVLVVQHMPAGFTDTLANRLNDLSQISVKEACDGEAINNGVVYIAKGGTHLTLTEENKVPVIRFDDSPPVVGLKPCGNIMYDSLCDSSFDEIICVVLTGMGADGTKGIMNLSNHKDIYVIAQDEKSSTVYGMPRAVHERGLTDCVCDINKVAKEITKKVGVL